MQDVKQRLKELNKQWTTLRKETIKGEDYWLDIDNVRRALKVLYNFQHKSMDRAQKGQMIKLESELGFISGGYRLATYLKMRAESGLY